MHKLRRRYGHAHGFKVGDSIPMVGPNGTAMGKVRKATPRRLGVWTGTTGFGQKTWMFDDAGRPVGLTRAAFPDLHLDIGYIDPFRDPGGGK
jgi:hypothetical protein